MNKLNEAQTTTARLESTVKVEIENHGNDLNSINKRKITCLELERAKVENEFRKSRRDCESLKDRVKRLVEDMKTYSNREKKIEDEFRRSRRECESLKEKITSLSEEKRLSSDREKRTKDRYAKVCEELKRSEKNCNELKEKVTRLVEDNKVSSDREKRIEDEFRRSRRECESLKEKITSLSEDKGLSRDREKRTEERYVKVCDELKRSQKNCDELNEKVTRLFEDKKISSDREKRTQEQYTKVCDELKSCRIERDELNERITRLLEDQTVLSEREKRAKEQYAKLCGKYSKAEDEKRKMILNLDEKTNELKNQKLETEKAAEIYEEKIQSLDLKVAEMIAEVEKLKQQKSKAHLNVKELKWKLLQADKTEEAYKKKFEDLNERIWNAEKDLAMILDVDVNDIQNLANDIGRSSIGTEGQCATDTILDHSKPVKKHLECVDIINIDDSDDEATEQEGSLVGSMSERKRSANGNKNNATFRICVQKEKRRRELISDGPESLVNDSIVKSKSLAGNQLFNSTDGGASTDTEDDSITTARINDLIGSF